MDESKKLIVDKLLIGVVASVISAGIVGWMNSSAGWSVFWMVLLYSSLSGIITYLIISLLQLIGSFIYKRYNQLIIKRQIAHQALTA